jgi:hypothetical protein
MKTVSQNTIDTTEFLPVGFAVGRTMAEIDALAAMLADPAAMYPLAEAEGLSWWHFGEPDTRIIFCAIGVRHEAGALAVLKLAKIGLRHARYWDDRLKLERLGTSLFWSDETLAKLADGTAGPDVCRWAARRLIDLHDRQHAAENAYRACFALVGGEGVDHAA